MAIIELKTILYIEDDLDIQFVAKMALEKIGLFEVKICNSGQEALELLKNWQPQLILMDVMMPGMDGPTTFKALREMPACVSIPVVFMTAKAQTHEIEGFKALGVKDVIIKPFDPLSLATQLKAIWENATSEA